MKESRSKILLLNLLALAILIGIAVIYVFLTFGRKEASQQFQSSYPRSEDYNCGYEVGKSDGYSRGYQDGQDAAESAHDSGYNEGYADGYADAGGQ